jgi:hypothetical protein
VAQEYNNEIFLFGGSGPAGAGEHSNVVEAYNPATNSWRSVTTIPLSFESNLMIAVVGSKAYIFGRYDGSTISGDVISYDFSNNTWTTSGYAPIPTPKIGTYASGLPVVNGKVYLIGGATGTRQAYWETNTVDIYDPATNTWSSGVPLPTPIDDHVTLALNNDIYVISGITSHTANDDIRTNAVWKYNITVNDDFPTPDIKANGSDGPVTVSFGDPFTLTVQLDAGSMSGQNADWWGGVNIASAPPADWYHYDLASGWMSGKTTTYQGPLFNLSPYNIPGMSGLPVGTYIFYFAVDMVMNGLLDIDQIYFDSVQVNISIPTCTDADNDTYATEGDECGLVDCNDNDPNIHPNANDICGDGIDQDCNDIDLNCNNDSSILGTWYLSTVNGQPIPPGVFLRWSFTESTVTISSDLDCVEVFTYDTTGGVLSATSVISRVGSECGSDEDEAVGVLGQYIISGNTLTVFIEDPELDPPTATFVFTR